MKRILIVLMVLALAVPLFAGGAVEKGKVLITVAGLTKNTHYDKVMADFKVLHPEVIIRPIVYSFGDGSTIALDALIASGSYPNILIDFTGRVGKYAVVNSTPGAWSALDMTASLGADIVNFHDLSAFKRDGKLLMVPETLPMQGMALSTDVLAKAGYTLPGPENWTIAEFEKMAAAVAKVPGMYPTVLFAKNQSADYLYVNWFGSFGAKFFDAGYTKSTLGKAGLDTFKWFDKIYKMGWTPKESPELWDDAMLEQYFAKGIVAATGIRAEWIEGYQKMGIDNKLIDKPFPVTMYPFPKAPGVKAVPSVGAGNTLVVCQTGNKAVDDLAGAFGAFLVSKANITDSITLGSGYSVRKDIVVPVAAGVVGPWQTMVNKILADGGVMDVGYTLKGYADIRAALFPLLQGMWTGQLTPEQAFAKYEAEINTALSK